MRTLAEGARDSSVVSDFLGLIIICHSQCAVSAKGLITFCYRRSDGCAMVTRPNFVTRSPAFTVLGREKTGYKNR